MPIYSTQTKLSPEEAIQEAGRYFGAGGLGLEMDEIGACCVRFHGGGGHVQVSAAKAGSRTTVDLETREWDHQVKQFIRRLT